VNYGIGQGKPALSSITDHLTQEAGQLTLRSLKLKKGALDKFQLPVDVLEGVYSKVLASPFLFG
jgi:hypothetical protein